MSTPQHTHEQTGKPDGEREEHSPPKRVSVRPARSNESDEHKLHWWNACPCHSGLRFGKCCGSTGEDTCRYEST